MQLPRLTIFDLLIGTYVGFNLVGKVLPMCIVPCVFAAVTIFITRL